MKTICRWSISLIVCLTVGNSIGLGTAKAETTTVNVPFTAVVHESCETPTTMQDLEDSHSACSVQTSTISETTVVENTDGYQSSSNGSDTQRHTSERTSTRIIVVGQ